MYHIYFVYKSLKALLCVHEWMCVYNCQVYHELHFAEHTNPVSLSDARLLIVHPLPDPNYTHTLYIDILQPELCEVNAQFICVFDVTKYVVFSAWFFPVLTLTLFPVSCFLPSLWFPVCLSPDLCLFLFFASALWFGFIALTFTKAALPASVSAFLMWQ